MKDETKGVQKSGSKVFGAPLQTLAAEELDRIFGGQAGPPNNPPSTPSPPPTTGPAYPGGPTWTYKPRGGYDYYGQEN